MNHSYRNRSRKSAAVTIALRKSFGLLLHHTLSVRYVRHAPVLRVW